MTATNATPEEADGGGFDWDSYTDDAIYWDEFIGPEHRVRSQHRTDVMITGGAGPTQYYIRCMFCGYQSDSTPDEDTVHEIAMDHFVTVRESRS